MIYSSVREKAREEQTIQEKGQLFKTQDSQKKLYIIKFISK